MAADLPERICPDASRTADVGVVVADAWQRRGVGALLMRALIARAQARGVTALAMDVLPGNRRVLAMILSPLARRRRRSLPGRPGHPHHAAVGPARRPRAGPAAGPGGPIASRSMTTVRPGHVTTAAVPPRDLAAALRGAGLTGVDDSARRRAEYSADASNYRVVPSVVVFPRHVDEAAGRAGRRPASRRAGHQPGGRDLHRGQRASDPASCSTSRRHLNRVLSVDPEARTAVVEPGAILDDITAAAARARAAVRPGPLHAFAGAASAARSATTPAARAR